MANQREYKLAIEIAGMVDKTLGDACTLTKRQLKEISKAAADANRSQVSFAAAMEQAAPGIDASWGALKTTISTVAAGTMAAGAALIAAGTASANVGSEFEAAMDSTAATAGATAAEYEKLRDAAMEMGRTTSKTATESANALEYMALAGWDVDTSIKGLPGVLRLSEATGLDLARTSDLVTDSMSALGVEIDGLNGYLDVAAKANNKSNQTAEQLMEAYLGVGGSLKNLNVPIQESAAALGVMANRGIKGSEAGNALNAVLINLTSGTGQAGKKMSNLGISAFDAQGKFIGLKHTLELVDSATRNLTEEERNAALAAIGGKQHIDALNDLLSGLNTTVADGVTEWDKLSDELYHADGALEAMAATKMDNLKGDIAIFQSAMEDAGIQIYDGLMDPMRRLTQEGTKLVYAFSEDTASTMIEKIPTVKRQLSEAADAIREFADPLLTVGGWMMEHPDVIAGTLGGIAATITSMKVAETLTSAAASVKTLGTALSSNPVMATVSVAALAGGAIVGLSTQAKIANERLKKNDLSEHFGNVTLSMTELETAAEKIIDNGNLSKIQSSMDSLSKVSDLSKGLGKTQQEMEKLNWKVEMGITLSESENGSYGQLIDQYVQNSLRMAEEQQYAMNLNLELLTGDDETGQAIVSQFNDYYSGLNQELKELGDQLGQAYAEGMKDGVLSMDEIATINELQRKMADITAKMSESRFEAQIETIGIKYSTGSSLDADTFQNLQNEIQAQVDAATASLEESLTLNISGAKLQLEDGAINKAQYAEMISEFEENYRNQVAEIQSRAASFQLDTMYSAYENEINAAMPEFRERMNSAIEQGFAGLEASGNIGETYGDYFASMLSAGLDSDSLKSSTKMAIEELLDSMRPSLEQMETIRKQAEEAGSEIPEGISDALTKAETLSVLTGDADAIWEYIGGAISNSDAYRSTYESVMDAGGTLPPAIGDGIADHAKETETGIDSVYNYVTKYAQKKFEKIPVYSVLDISFDMASVGTEGYNVRPKKHADGGIFDTPHYGVFAEAGPEAFIPLDRSAHSVSIWEEAGRQLGVGDHVTNNTDSSRVVIQYSPVYQMADTSRRNELERVSSEDYERFVSFMNRYERDRSRLAF